MTPDGARETVVRRAGPVSGLGWLPDGRMLVVSMVDRRLLRHRAGRPRSATPICRGVATGHCNDMVVDADGRAYVGNFGFDYPDGEREAGASWRGSIRTARSASPPTS